MVSSSKEGNGSLMFEPNKPHFFKIILGETISKRKLYIPKKFALKHGDDLSCKVVLTVPSGRKWHVELVKCGGKIRLENGWPEFMEYYSIAIGDFLVFAYDQKTCCFDVIIFDKSATEIDYPINNEDDKSLILERSSKNQKIKKVKMLGSVEILDHTSPCQKTGKDKSSEPFPQPYKEIKVETSTKQEEGRTDFKVNKGDGGTSSNRKRNNRIVSGKRLTYHEKFDAIQRAKTKYATKNPNFMIPIQPSFVGPRYDWACIPASFAKKYLHENHYNATLISVLDGSIWSVEFTIQKRCRNLRARISHGWKKFAKENHLKLGDVCIFELINRAKTTYKVTIFPNSQVKNCYSSSCSTKELETELVEMLSNPIIPPGAAEATKKFIPKHPFFRADIRSYHLRKNDLHVPREFMAVYAKQNTENVMLEVKRRQWPVKLIRCRQYNRGRFSAGWCSFATENSLQVGDACIFEWINGKTGIIKVSIFRRAS